MEIDPVEVAILAIASIIGAVGVAIVWAWMTNLLGIRRRALVSFCFLLVGSVSGIAFLYDPLLDVLATPLVHILPDPVYIEMAMEDPLLDRLSRDHPELLEGLEAKLISAHMVSGIEGVRFETERFGLQKSTGLTSDYFSRARAEDLIDLMALQGEVFQDLAKNAPELCYPFLFGLDAGDMAVAARMDEEIPLGVEKQTRALILNANARVPEFDYQLGEMVIRKAQVDVALEHGARGVQLMSGEYRPQTEEEARELCAVYADFFAAVSSQNAEHAGAAWRSMFVQFEDS